MTLRTEGKIYAFVEKYFKENHEDFIGRGSIYYRNDIPYDSVDRFVALYMIEHEPTIIKESVDIIRSIKNNAELNAWYESLKENHKEFIKEFELVETWAYNNYEREGMSNAGALANIIDVAEKGKETVLQDSYYNGGWFGAS